jgi:hypothetical protein
MTTHVHQPSLFAYHKQVIPTRSRKKQEVFDVLSRTLDMTNSELAEALHWGINRVTPRIAELREAGLVGCRNPQCPNRAHLNAHSDIVHDACKRRCKVTGASVFAWRSIDKR